MKKVLIACAAILTLGLMSCGDTKMCYKLSVEVQGETIMTYYQYGTSNEIDAYIVSLKKTQEKVYGEGVVTIKRDPLSNMKSEADCKGAQLILD